MTYNRKGKIERNMDKVGKNPKLKRLVWLFLRWYNEILVFCRAVAVSLDPLFFYVPVIKEDKKCVELNKVLWIIAIVSRSVADFIYLVHSVVKSKILNKSTPAKRRKSLYFWSIFMLNILVILPIPQVLGAFWYLFSTQRLTACWHKAFENRTDGFEISFNCGHSSSNLSFLDDFCPIDSPNTSTFNFGIFLEARRSGILESTGFLQKVFYCFWWGMRNLSSFGSNLQTSRYIWENIFALGISISGLLLFLYFMGNLQVYMQDSASESIKKSDVGELLRKLGQLYKERASKLDDADVDKLVTELEQLYKQYFIASKFEKDAVQKSDVGNLLIKLAEIYKQPASTSIENSETEKNVLEKLGTELGQLYKQCKDAVQPKSDGAVVEAASISESV